MNGKRRLIGSFNHGVNGDAMAQAIGIQALDRKRQVVAMCGDGGFTMLMGDFISLLNELTSESGDFITAYRFCGDGNESGGLFELTARI